MKTQLLFMPVPYVVIRNHTTRANQAFCSPYWSQITLDFVTGLLLHEENSQQSVVDWMWYLTGLLSQFISTFWKKFCSILGSQSVSELDSILNPAGRQKW